MRDLLGGKGANVAEMTRILGPDRVPGGFTITTEACVAYLREERDPRGARRAGRRRAGGARGARGQEARRRRRPAARVGALGRARVDARHARHGPQPRPQRRLGPTGWPRTTGTSVSPGTLPPLRADVRERGARDRRQRFEAAIAERKQGRPAPSGTTPSWIARRCSELTARIPGRSTSSPPSRASSSSTPRSAPCSTPGSGERAAPTPHQPDPRRLGHRGDRPADGVRQQGRHLRGRVSRSPATRSPASPSPRRLPSPTHRARTSCRACEPHATSPSSRRWQPAIHAQLIEILRELERHYGDMQDTEFTVEDGQLYMLQTRNAKRPSPGGGAVCGGRGRRGPATPSGARHHRRRDARRAPSPDLRPAGRVRACWPSGWPRLPGAAMGEIVFDRRRCGRPPPATGATSSSRGRSPRPTTSPASTRPRES